MTDKMKKTKVEVRPEGAVEIKESDLDAAAGGIIIVNSSELQKDTSMMPTSSLTFSSSTEYGGVEHQDNWRERV